MCSNLLLRTNSFSKFPTEFQIPFWIPGLPDNRPEFRIPKKFVNSVLVLIMGRNFDSGSTLFYIVSRFCSPLPPNQTRYGLYTSSFSLLVLHMTFSKKLTSSPYSVPTVLTNNQRIKSQFQNGSFLPPPPHPNEVGHHAIRTRVKLWNFQQ